MGSRNKKDIVLDTKAILAKHLKRKADYEESLKVLEEQMHAFEASYLEDTVHHGNVSKGWVSPARRLKHRSPNAARRAFLQQYKDSDRIFSYCSSSSPIYYNKPIDLGVEQEDEEEEEEEEELETEDEQETITSSGIFKSVKIKVKPRVERNLANLQANKKQAVGDCNPFKAPEAGPSFASDTTINFTNEGDTTIEDESTIIGNSDNSRSSDESIEYEENTIEDDESSQRDNSKDDSRLSQELDIQPIDADDAVEAAEPKSSPTKSTVPSDHEEAPEKTNEDVGDKDDHDNDDEEQAENETTLVSDEDKDTVEDNAEEDEDKEMTDEEKRDADGDDKGDDHKDDDDGKVEQPNKVAITGDDKDTKNDDQEERQPDTQSIGDDDDSQNNGDDVEQPANPAKELSSDDEEEESTSTPTPNPNESERDNEETPKTD